ncbi:Iron-sulfur cluster assembly 1, mitochondrial [Portunus trituberculatus]|uniref:Iron-sulfur cluster assembly 1, mitochondrial n=1 Tax=Portunus trituberculatus TaxID=210409 RepID=A0A5B7J3E2_PORTR|nr:Iron-sulfur cluster assembly 1, mitochondrial [Portunus trituberculatus]
MDYVTEKLSSEFVFNNPNIKGTCGCGGYFNVLIEFNAKVMLYEASCITSKVKTCTVFSIQFLSNEYATLMKVAYSYDDNKRITLKYSMNSARQKSMPLGVGKA